MKSKIALILLICTSLLIRGIAVAGAGYGKQKVVYHINYDDPKAQAGALRNIQNHINAVGEENLDLKVVMHGKGLSLLLSRCPKITSRSCLLCCPSSAFQQELHNPAMRPLLRLEYEQHCFTISGSYLWTTPNTGST